MLSISTPIPLALIIASALTIIVLLRLLCRHVTDFQTAVIPRHHNATRIPNPLFRKALSYLSSLPSLESSDHILIFSSARKNNEFLIQPDPKRPTVLSDLFHGIPLRWSLAESELKLTFRRNHRSRVLRPYLQHVELIADEINSKRKDLKLHSVTCNDGTKVGWNLSSFSHPANFDTVFMDPDLKAKIQNDLEMFSKGRIYYNLIGKVWKRSYVLYGQPGTGKTAFVAAMAKFLNYDVFNLDLTKVNNTCDVNSLILQTSTKSVVLIENFDKYTDEMLSFMKGIFSSCCEERLFVYTTNTENEDETKRVECDVNIHFPLCDFNGFKSLASTYLGLKDHKLYTQVEEGFERGGKMSHGEMGDIMISYRGSPSKAIKNVINALHKSSPLMVKPLHLSNHDDEVSRANSERFGKEATVREIKKLYGLIRRNGSKKEGVMSVEMAAAAAAAAVGSCGVGYESSGKEGGR